MSPVMIQACKRFLCFSCSCVSHVAAVAKQAKYLEQRLQLQAGEDEEGGGADEQEEGGRLWGANKRAYYDADTAEVGERCCCSEGLLCRCTVQ